MEASGLSTVKRYYNSLESRVGYRLFLGGTKHFGYYVSATEWPWPIPPALRAMEATMLAALGCGEGDRVLDAGCGDAHVALFMAQKGGLHVEGIDLTPRHIRKAAENIRRARAADKVSVRVGDFHDLRVFEDNSFDGVYTMETFVHSANPRKVLQEFLRVLKPGGCLVMYEYDHAPIKTSPKHVGDRATLINTIVGMPAFQAFETDDIQRLLKSAGFGNVEGTDMSKNIVPMLWLFYICACIPWLFIRLLGLEYYFPSTFAAVPMYLDRDYWRYMAVKAKKPL